MDNYLNLSTDWYHIRNMCIKHNFYTCGDCREYQRLCDYVNTCETCMDNKDLIFIVLDIWVHSDFSNGDYDSEQEQKKYIEYCILNECTYITSDIEY